MAFAGFDPLLESDLTLILRLVKVVQHGCPFIDGALEVLFRFNFHQAYADVADGVVKAITMLLLNNHLIFHSGCVRQTLDLLRIAPGHAGRRPQGQSARGTGGDASCLHSEQLGDPFAYGTL